jgi:perosamine synthetase
MRDNGWIKLASPWVGGEELRAVESVFSSGRLVRGSKGREFEEKIRAVVGVRHAFAVSSGTTAIFAVLHALGLGEGDEVILPALSFPAAAECVVMVGATPVFVDVQPGSFNMNPAAAAQAVTDRTRALIAIDQFGVSADYPALEGIVRGRGIPLIEDAACALGGSLGGRPCGCFGKAAVFSFHPRKVITTGEGGMVLTSDDDLAAAIDRIRNHGIDRDGRFAAAGLNFRMSEVQAAVGICQMGKLPEILEKRRRLASFYRRHLEGVVDFQEAAQECSATWQTVAAVMPGKADETARNRIIREMAGGKIELQVASYSAGRLEPYRRFCAGKDFPVSDRIHDCGLALPAHSMMDEEDAAAVCDALKKLL